MDQATDLRKLMNNIEMKKEKEKESPIAFLATSDFPPIGELLKNISRERFRLNRKKILLLGSGENEEEWERILTDEKNINASLENSTSGVMKIEGSLSFFSSVRGNEVKTKSLNNALRKAETASDQIYYYAGRGNDPTAINLSLMTDKVVILMEPTTKSLVETNNLLKIFSKTNSNKGIGFLVDTGEQRTYQAVCQSLQEFSEYLDTYSVSPMGMVEMDKEDQGFDVLQSQYLDQPSEKKILSESVRHVMT